MTGDWADDWANKHIGHNNALGIEVAAALRKAKQDGREEMQALMKMVEKELGERGIANDLRRAIRAAITTGEG